MNIVEALAQFDGLDDDQWTADGAPKIEVVSKLVEKKVSRADIIQAAPKFSRENMDLSELPKESIPDLVASVDPVVEQESVIDLTPLKEFAEMEPMLPEELAEKVLKNMPVDLLPEVEKLLINQIAEVAARQTEIEEINRKLKMSLATTRSWIKTLIPDMSDQEAIQHYIKKSNENRAAKADMISKALGGLKPADLIKLDPRAAIDRAFARKTARGVQRPVR